MRSWFQEDGSLGRTALPRRRHLRVEFALPGCWRLSPALHEPAQPDFVRTCTVEPASLRESMKLLSVSHFMKERLDGRFNDSIVQINGSRSGVATVLGSNASRIPIGGKIRAGIKVLTKRAAENPRAKEIYERGVESGQPFEQIERAIVEAVPELKTPLVPKNVPWFTVRGEDFPNPSIAKNVLHAFGEDRGDGVVRLYRFPVVFPSDTWQTIMPHELVAWGANGKKFWSEYSADGRGEEAPR